MTTTELNEKFYNELVEEYGERVIALAQHLNLNLELGSEYEDEEEKQEAIQEIKSELEQIQEATYNNNLLEYYNESYLVLTDKEADDAWEDELQNYIDECIMPELERMEENSGIRISYYFDEEAWKRDARFDGRGQSLNRYDGTEYEEKVNGTWYYIYRQD